MFSKASFMSVITVPNLFLVHYHCHTYPYSPLKLTVRQDKIPYCRPRAERHFVYEERETYDQGKSESNSTCDIIPISLGTYSRLCIAIINHK
jgi:hypothetical protein